ncbi:major facilitator superfamily domain-containing protein [Phthorimaea operculella]|nr:major facilitator superfamily domain-containing protein [Phthorimaea operculella]
MAVEMEERSGQHYKIEKKCESKQETVDYDKLLSSAGEFGLYQTLLLFSTMPFYIFAAFTYFSQLFMTEVPQNHWCWIPELANLTPIERRNLAIPNDTASQLGYSRCSAYAANWTEVLSTGGRPNSSWEMTTCQYGWEFNKSEIPYPTISSEMGWVCDRGSYQATAQSIFFVGSIVGGFLVGWVADRFGRLPGAAFCNLIGCLAGIATIFVTDFTQFAVCRFFMGMSYDNCLMLVYILVLEYVAPKYRALAANLPFGFFFCLGLCILPWISLACGHWKVISLATSLPMALALLAPFVMPESPRWLLSKGRVDDTIEKVKTIARLNKKVIPDTIIEEFKRNENDSKEEAGSIIGLLKRPVLCKMFVFACVLYMADMIVFDGLVRTAGSLNFDFFLSFTVMSFTEFPALFIISFILDWTGRKWLSFTALLVSGVFSLLSVFVGSGLPSVMCAVVARFAINMACNCAMQWAAEIMPTSVRGTGISIIHICGYIGTVISPFIVYLNTVIDWLPLIIFGVVAFVGAALSLGLPETSGKQMPQTFDDAEDLMKMDRLTFPCVKKSQDTTFGHVNNSFELD